MGGFGQMIDGLVDVSQRKQEGSGVVESLDIMGRGGEVFLDTGQGLLAVSGFG